MAEPPAPRKRVKDEEVVALLVKVILEEGTVSSQSRLAELVNRQLKRRGATVTPARARVLAVRSGLVGIHVRTRAGGPTPDLARCPVCGSKLRRTANRTLTGSTAQTGYKCTRCPWWTGRELRVPHHYVFQAKVARLEGGNPGQLSFLPTRRS
ncbi:MAG: hypothetical protein QOE90_168 [Thermoplasmata archaeon]|nr:hypothetical protein [Thermoplasmata archaeon]